MPEDEKWTILNNPWQVSLCQIETHYSLLAPETIAFCKVPQGLRLISNLLINCFVDTIICDSVIALVSTRRLHCSCQDERTLI